MIIKNSTGNNLSADEMYSEAKKRLEPENFWNPSCLNGLTYDEIFNLYRHTEINLVGKKENTKCLELKDSISNISILCYFEKDICIKAFRQELFDYREMLFNPYNEFNGQPIELIQKLAKNFQINTPISKENTLLMEFKTDLNAIPHIVTLIFENNICIGGYTFVQL